MRIISFASRHISSIYHPEGSFENLFLTPGHCPGFRVGKIIPSAKMEHAVNDTKSGFMVRRVAVSCGIFHQDSGAQKQLAVLKSDDIRRGSVIKKIAVHSPDGRVAEDRDVHSPERKERAAGFCGGQAVVLSGGGNVPDSGGIELHRTLAVINRQDKPHRTDQAADCSRREGVSFSFSSRLPG